MPDDHSFDVVSKINMQELRNAIQQAQKEIITRFDFRGTSAGLEFDEPGGLVKLTADHSAQLNSVREVINGKLARRGVAVNSLSWKEPEALPAGTVKQQASLQQGLSSEKAKDVVKLIKDLGLKVQPRIDGDAVRVAGKQLDDLQAVIKALRSKDFGVPLQMENYR